MKVTPVKFDSISGVRYDKRKILKTLEEFRDSDFDAVRVDYTEGEYSCVNSLQSTLGRAIRTYKMYNLKCIVRDRVCYLIKVSPEEEESNDG